MKCWPARRRFERQNPLAADGIEGTSCAWRDHHDFAAAIEQAKFMDRKGRFAEFLFEGCDGAAKLPGGYPILRHALNGADCNEVAKAVKVLAPASVGANQTQAFPILKAARFESEDAANFAACISLRQTLSPPRRYIGLIMHPVSTCPMVWCLWKSAGL